MRFYIAVSALVGTILGAALGAPYLYAEYALRRHGAIIGPPPRRPINGRWIDDYYLVEVIDSTTYAIGEPRYYQGNYSYLILGTKRAVLFDGGSGNRDIVPVVQSLTRLPVTVAPSHLHFDHVGALGQFERTAVLDDRSLRARSRDGLLALKRYEFLGFADNIAAPKVRVDEWWRPGSTVDLGERCLVVLHTPGHAPASMSLYDSQHTLLFCGDFIYPGPLYAFLPGASRHAYLRTTEQLLATLDPTTEILAAHMDQDSATVAAPRLGVIDLRALLATLRAIDGKTARSTGFYPRIFPVRGSIRFATGFPWSNR